jgi:TrmH family RNA methyltransferase
MGKIQILRIINELRTLGGRQKHAMFSVEGHRLIERALESDAPLRGVAMAKSTYEKPNLREQQIITTLEHKGCTVQVVEDKEIEIYLEGRTFGALLGIVDLPQAWDLEKLLADRDLDLRLLIVENAQDPGNIGALMRTAKASHVDAMVLLGGTDPYHPKASRTSMGAIFDLRILRATDDLSLLDQLSETSVQKIGAVIKDGIMPCDGKVTNRWALFAGSEAHGLSKPLQERLDLRWTIPMHSAIDSFSLNAATAVLLYELNRRIWAR